MPRAGKWSGRKQNLSPSRREDPARRGGGATQLQLENGEESEARGKARLPPGNPTSPHPVKNDPPWPTPPLPTHTHCASTTEKQTASPQQRRALENQNFQATVAGSEERRRHPLPGPPQQQQPPSESSPLTHTGPRFPKPLCHPIATGERARGLCTARLGATRATAPRSPLSRRRLLDPRVTSNTPAKTGKELFASSSPTSPFPPNTVLP